MQKKLCRRKTGKPSVTGSLAGSWNLEGYGSFLHRGACTAQPPTPGCRSAPASVAFLKGQVLTTRGRGLKPRTRGVLSRSGRRSQGGGLHFRAIAERPAEQCEKSPG